MVDYTQLTFVRHLQEPAESRRAHARSAIAEREVRVARGVYTDEQLWRGLDDRERYLFQVRSVADTRRAPPVVSHWSAAAVHGLPVVGSWPDRVHLTQRPGSGARSRGRVIRHSLPLAAGDIVRVDGMWVTSISRTLVDLAAVAGFRVAVTMADAALHIARFADRPPMVTVDQLRSEHRSRMPFVGHARAQAVIDFASTEADTPIESVSRVVMRELGAPPPVLQLEHRDSLGLIGHTDFAWPELGIVGEADGATKYLDEAHRGGRTVEEVVYAEKLREDRLRALGLTVIRWPWSVAISPQELARRLSAGGVPIHRRFR